MQAPYCHNTKRQGFGLLETIVAIGLFLVVGATAIQAILGGLTGERSAQQHAQATAYAQEGLEGARSLVKQGWTTAFLATNCSSGCGVSRGGGLWAWSGASTVSNGYTRTITVSPTQRDGSNTIVTSGGTTDDDTKRVTATVTWSPGPARTNTVTLDTYVTQYWKSIGGNWALPSLQASLDLTVANSGNNTANGSAIAYANSYAYTGKVTSGGTELQAINVSTLATPTLCGTCTRELGGTAADLAVNGSVLYIASSNDTQELQVISIASPTALSSATLTGVDLTAGNSGNANADGVALALSGSNLFMIRAGGNEFIRFSVATPASPTLSATGADFVGTPTDMVVVGSYAYVTSNDNANELQIMNTTTMARDGTTNINSGNENADALSVMGTGTGYLLVGRASSAAPELYVYDLTNPASPTLVGTYEVGANVIDISWGSPYAFLITAATNEFQVLNLSSLPTVPAPPAFGQLNIANSPVNIWYESSVDRVFSVGSSDTAEFEIIQPQ